MALTKEQLRAIHARRNLSFKQPESPLKFEKNKFAKMDKRIDPKHRLTPDQLFAIQRAKESGFYNKRDIETGFIIDPSIDHFTGKKVKAVVKPFFEPHGVAVHGWDATCISCNKRGTLSPPQKSEKERLREVKEFVNKVEISNIRRQRDNGVISEEEFQERSNNIKELAGVGGLTPRSTIKSVDTTKRMLSPLGFPSRGGAERSG